VKKFTSEEEINSQLRDLTAEMRRLRSELVDRTRPRSLRQERLIGRHLSSPPESTSSRDT
jgi:hypothetical protein